MPNAYIKAAMVTSPRAQKRVIKIPRRQK